MRIDKACRKWRFFLGIGLRSSQAVAPAPDLADPAVTIFQRRIGRSGHAERTRGQVFPFAATGKT